MRALPILALALPFACTLASVAQAQPKRLGDYGSWTAATSTEGGQKICYAFARAAKAEGVPGRAANTVMLVVTHRPQGRDQVALQSGYAYPRQADGAPDPVQVSVGPRSLGFFTAGTSAFAREGAAAVAAFRNGRQAVAKGPGPNGRGQASDTFPLAGFGAAYDAISKECPAAPAGGGGARR
jgi:hypothetical protein